MNKSNLRDIRREYQKNNLDKKSVDANPFVQFKKWLDEALQCVPDDPTAMILSTVSSNGMPSSRIVLLKDYNEEVFTFFSNYESKKANDLLKNSKASILFFWKELERQIRIEGVIEKTDSKTSDAYFKSRPFESRVSAIISKQSQEVTSREKLDSEFENLKKRVDSKKLSRPDYWGGYLLNPVYFEFWQGRENRLHDRIVYLLEDENWMIKRIAP